MPNNFFRFKQFTIYQDDCAMKVGTDGTLLGSWAAVPESPHPHVLDIGTGTGLIAIMMAQRFPGAHITGIDIDGMAAGQALENAAASPFADRISIAETAVQDMEGGPFDAIVCNPPYFIDSLTCPDEQRSLARHTLTLTYDALMGAARRLLSDAGELSVIIPTASRGMMDAAAAIAGLFPRRICEVKTTERKPAKRCMLAYTKRNRGETENSVIVIGSDRYNEMLRDFYLKL